METHIDWFEAASLLARRPPSEPTDDWEGERHFAEPYYVTAHAIETFKERVTGELSDRAIINLIQAELQKRRLVIEPGFRTAHRAYACTYRETVGKGRSAVIHDVPFYALVDPHPSTSQPGPDGRIWPQVVTIKGERLTAKHGPAYVRRQPTLVGELFRYWQRYSDPVFRSEMEPLRVVIETAGIVAGYDPPTLDGLLARCVVDEALGGHGLDGTGAPYVLPVPLHLLWTCPDTKLPLWACNHLAPAGPGDAISVYWHKRSIRPEHARQQKGQPQPYSIKGRYKEKRVPLPARTETLWWADCIGHRDEVERLLRTVDSIGKKRMATVTALSVVPLEDRFRMNRPVPVTYFDPSTQLQGRVYTGWTPPYWAGVPECHAECAMPQM